MNTTNERKNERRRTKENEVQVRVLSFGSRVFINHQSAAEVIGYIAISNVGSGVWECGMPKSKECRASSAVSASATCGLLRRR